MNLSEYQQAAKTTAIYPEQYRVFYPALGLAGEAGEIANKVKKILRDTNGAVTEQRRDELSGEIGDILWYAAALASDLGLSLDAIAAENLAKLFDRKERGVLGGSGDHR